MQQNTINVNYDYSKNFIKKDDFDKFLVKSQNSFCHLLNRDGAGNEFTGWLDLPSKYDVDEYCRIKKASEKIRKNSDIFIVIGIGGSYLGSRAAIEYIFGDKFNSFASNNRPQIYFAGNTISSSSLNDLLKICDGKDISINVISKSGTTTEPAVVFRIFKKLLEEKYGSSGAKERIYVTTDSNPETKLKGFALKKGYETFTIPSNVGGRYSVLTPVGLLPMAVAGIDIDGVLSGASSAQNELGNLDNIKNNIAIEYSAYRNYMLSIGKNTEILVSYEPACRMFQEWWKQLYGESEGKDFKGIYPSSVINTTDLHSLGQYIQEGQRNLIETVLTFESSSDNVVVQNDSENIDGLNFLSGKSLDYINKMATLGTLLAHSDGGVPNLQFIINKRNEFSFGYLVFFFEVSCAVSGYTLGVNPFNQPGVEKYKKNMFALLNKPGFEKESLIIKERIINN